MIINDRIKDFARRLEPRLAREFIAAVKDMRDAIDIRQLERAIADGDIDRALAAASVSPGFWTPFTQAVLAAYATAGSGIVEALPVRRVPMVSVRFDGRSDRAIAWANEHGGSAVADVMASARENVRKVMAEALSEGWNPRRTALEIAGRIDKVSGRRVGGVLGLSSDLEEHVRRARIELADPSGMRRFLTRSLRDRRYDGRVRLAIAEGRKLSQADYDLLVSRYSDRLLKYRAERVARTESTAALNAGRLEGMRQAVDAGRLRQDQVKKRWRSALDKRTRDTHIGMHNQVVPFDKPFQSPRGALLMYPSDIALGAGPSEVVNCRCTFEFEVSF